MSTHHMLVFTNPVEGKENEFHEWYDHVHIPDCLRIGGFTAVTRYEVARLQASLRRVGVDEKTGGVTQRYLAVWELEGDLKEIFANAREEFASGRIRMADVFTDAEVYLFTEIRDRVRACDIGAAEVA